jgi:hypothetical protein
MAWDVAGRDAGPVTGSGRIAGVPSGNENELPDDVPLREERQGMGGVLEREAGGRRRQEPTARDAPEDVGQQGGAASGSA